MNGTIFIRGQKCQQPKNGVEERFAGSTFPSPDEITEAFWQACHGGQRGAAEYLLEQGADLDWIGYDGLTPLDTARRSNADELVEWLRDRGANSASEL
ncbi:ankyrin repeat domain-containing protein [Paenibacillus alkaliterrae]